MTYQIVNNKKSFLFLYLILTLSLCFPQNSNENIPIKNKEIIIAENFLERVNALMSEMKYDSIPYYLNNSIPVFMNNNLGEQYAECLYAKGEYFYHALKNVDSTNFYIDNAISECSKHLDDTNLLVYKVHLLSSYLLNYLREYDQSIAEAKKAIPNKLNNSYDEKKLLSTCYNIIAINYKRQGEYSKAEQFYKRQSKIHFQCIRNLIKIFPVSTIIFHHYIMKRASSTNQWIM